MAMGEQAKSGRLGGSPGAEGKETPSQVPEPREKRAGVKVRGTVAIKIPKSISLSSASLVGLKNGRLFLKTQNIMYPIFEISLEIPKYLIDGEGHIISQITTKGVIRREGVKYQEER